LRTNKYKKIAGLGQESIAFHKGISEESTVFYFQVVAFYKCL